VKTSFLLYVSGTHTYRERYLKTLLAGLRQIGQPDQQQFFSKRIILSRYGRIKNRNHSGFLVVKDGFIFCVEGY
jgi:hypothetical protein